MSDPSEHGADGVFVFLFSDAHVACIEPADHAIRSLANIKISIPSLEGLDTGNKTNIESYILGYVVALVQRLGQRVSRDKSVKPGLRFVGKV